jgi:hypothetical protein
MAIDRDVYLCVYLYLLEVYMVWLAKEKHAVRIAQRRLIAQYCNEISEKGVTNLLGQLFDRHQARGERKDGFGPKL